MNALLSDILIKNEVRGKDGHAYKLHSHTSREQCEFLQDIIIELKLTNSLEIGLAYGVSTLAVLEALSRTSLSFCHLVIDPLREDWNNIGIANIDRAGFAEYVKFYSRFSNQELPQLYYENYRIQFACWDSYKPI